MTVRKEKTQDQFGVLVEGNNRMKLTRYGNHVLNRVITISKVGKRSGLVDNSDLIRKSRQRGFSRNSSKRTTYGGFLGADLDVLDVIGSLAGVLQLLVDDVGGFGSGLSVYNRASNLALAH